MTDLAIPAAEIAPPPAPALASFRRRFFAMAVDCIALLLAGLSLGLAFGAAFARLGVWGRLIGFAIAAAYFTALDGPAGGGRSLGKRALGIQVVDSNGQPPALPAAAIRGSFLGALCALNGYFAFGKWYEPKIILLGIFALAVAASLYLTIFDRRRRQGAHDLAAGTFVTRSGRPWAPPGSRNRLHVPVLIGLFVLLALAGELAWLAFKPTLEPLISLRDAVAARSGRSEVGVNRNTMTMYDRGGRKTTTSLLITVMYYVDPGEKEVQRVADDVALDLLTGGYDLTGVDHLVFTAVTGYNIGIASAFRSRRAGATPAALRTHLVYRGKLEDPNLDSTGRLMRAAVSGTPGDVEALIRSGANPNLPGPEGGTPLTNAAFAGRDEIVQALLASGADPNVRDDKDESPLLHASAAGHADVVRRLIAAKADVRGHQTEAAYTPLLIAIDRGHADIVRILLDAGADPNDYDHDNATALEHAAKVHRDDIAEMLIKSGARTPPPASANRTTLVQ